MKALANHPLAAQSLFEDDSLQLLFQMVADGSFTIFFQGKRGLVLLHSIQLHRHAMQSIGLLLINDNRSTARYIRRNHLGCSSVMKYLLCSRFVFYYRSCGFCFCFNKSVKSTVVVNLEVFVGKQWRRNKTCESEEGGLVAFDERVRFHSSLRLSSQTLWIMLFRVRTCIECKRLQMTHVVYETDQTV
ncbi:BEACH domain-containing protein lvsA-like [Pyrus ussuriensis x Pyrus communis]|uniref:BEACH domain-containing protein lvsA-like n=1 Tax=Pyrus ussuriensis x Pyrus communis TaxID=2448454 RepID=A0A5N5FQX7_9ROSA|nr:BEACH domain-containing protein lvsA-like [Pyrus ussuriensis x Pyrus communis]